MDMKKQIREGKSERDFEPEDQTGAKERSDTEARREPAYQENEAGEIQTETVEKEEDLKSYIDWENRILCEDGNCIGVIGPDGFCKECGRPCEGGGNTYSPKKDSDSTVFVSDDEDGEDSHANGSEAEDSAEDEKAADIEKPAEKADLDLEWKQRQLCSDGNCIGVIGPDGLCKECGKPYENEAR